MESICGTWKRPWKLLFILTIRDALAIHILLDTVYFHLSAYRRWYRVNCLNWDEYAGKNVMHECLQWASTWNIAHPSYACYLRYSIRRAWYDANINVHMRLGKYFVNVLATFEECAFLWNEWQYCITTTTIYFVSGLLAFVCVYRLTWVVDLVLY